MKVSFISLGCAKNLVDSEYILGLLREDNNIEIVDDIHSSDAIFINTCGFIASAKKEAIDTIFQVILKKKKRARLIVIGCLAKRYKEELYKEIPEIDLIVGVDEYDTIGDKLNALFKLSLPSTYDPLRRSLSSPLPVAYLKIGEGCSNKCAFCAIPLIRGKFVSYPKEQIIADCKRLISLGKKEIIVVAQDPTRYGKDIYKDYGLRELLDDILPIDKTVKFRVLYLYPDRLDLRVIDAFKEYDNLIKYFDIPTQHASDHVLNLMKRSGTKEKYLSVIHKIKKEIPGAVLRTTLITGFPGETEEDFNELKDFVKEIGFDHLGVFAFSDEEGTAANLLENKVDGKTARARAKEIMKIQKQISYNLNKKRVGEVHEVIIEDFDGEKYYGRSYLYAPDADDGSFIIESDKPLIIGETYNVKVTKALSYDLKGKVVSLSSFDNPSIEKGLVK